MVSGARIHHMRRFYQPFLNFYNRLDALMGRGIIFGFVLLALLIVGAAWAAFHFVSLTAPPSNIKIAAGPEGSAFQRYAVAYQTLLGERGVHVDVVLSKGSVDNLNILLDEQQNVDVGFIQGGLPERFEKGKLVSLGSVAKQPLMLFYRGQKRTLLSQFAGLRLAIGPEGSGVRFLALDLLALNGIGFSGETILVYTAPADSAAALREDRIDALFVMSESASIEAIKALRDEPDVHLYNFRLAEAYTRHIHYLSSIEVPQGGFDVQYNLPRQSLHLVAPTVELVASPDLHPAISDLLLEAASKVHGGASLLHRSGEFPAPLAREFPLSSDAERYYESGKSFLYRVFPFWLASLMSRILALVAPLLLLFPLMRFIPAIYRWRMESRVLRWYGVLRPLENELVHSLPDSARKQEILDELDEIEASINHIKIPAAFANLLYDLRTHIEFVRSHAASLCVMADASAGTLSSERE